MAPALALYNDEENAPARFLLPSKLPALANGSAANASAAVPAWALRDDNSGLTQFAKALLGIQRQVLLRVSQALNLQVSDGSSKSICSFGTPVRPLQLLCVAAQLCLQGL